MGRGGPVFLPVQSAMGVVASLEHTNSHDAIKRRRIVIIRFTSFGQPVIQLDALGQ
jgi:hypothetical protein